MMVNRKMTKKDKKYDYKSRKAIFHRANSSALAGMPISYGLNLAVVIPLTVWMVAENHHPLTIAAMIAIPFYVASVFRMYVIDWAWFKYKINIDPKNIFTNIWNYIHG